MEQLALLAGGRTKGSSAGKKGVKRLTKSSKIIKTIIAAIEAKKGEKIVLLDLRKINEAVADFFIICEAGNHPQIRAIADYVMDELQDRCAEKPYRQEGQKQMQWVLIDYVNVVVHVITPELRRFYKLEDMWSDADCTEIGASKK
ncbi:MAG: ribosome silencing factor [Bacteroidetes bacterium]|nr:ribosome silencing factor [Bacteroidota bacterium]